MRILPPHPPDALAEGRVLLRPPVLADVALLPDAVRDPEIARWLPDLPRPFTETHAKAWVEEATAAWHRDEPARAVFSIVTRDSREELLGALELATRGSALSIVEVGYWLRRSARGRGVATTALALATRWALLEGDFEGLRVMANLQNEASWRVAERCGLFRERACAGMVRYSLSRDSVARLGASAWAPVAADEPVERRRVC